jgi:flagellar P-ring protein precursor FlgI
VSAISAKSLAGGRLFVTPLLGPDPSDRRVYGIAQGQVALDDPTGVPTSGKVQGGCMLETDFDREFIRNNSITIVLDTNKAGFQVASDVAEAVNSQVLGLVSSTEGKFARAIDQSRVVVPIPNAYLAAPSEGREADPILFISEVMSVSLAEPQIEARVVINERAGTMAISGDVEIGAVTITYKSITVEAGEDQFVLLDQEDRALTTQEKERAGQKTKLSALLDTLNKIRASDSDRIGIVKAIHRTGKLHAKLIIQ